MNVPTIQIQNCGNTYITYNFYGDHAAVNDIHENNYKAVVEWLQAEKEAGHDWYAMNNNNRVRMCTQISEVLGWIVDANSLGHAINRK